MITINGLSATPLQSFNVPLDDGTIVYFTLRYNPAVQMWFANIEHEDFTLNGLRLCNNFNLLHQYKNIIPFGLFVEIVGESEPLLINDFQSERVRLNILTAAEVEQLSETFISD